MDGVVVAERNRPDRSVGYIKAITVVHLVELVFQLKVAQLGTVSMAFVLSQFKHHNPHPHPCHERINIYQPVDSIRYHEQQQVEVMVLEADSTTRYAMKKQCLAMPEAAR